jgi:hypothetical protein
VLAAKVWTRFFLVSIVCSGHFVLIASFSHGFTLGKGVKTNRVNNSVLVVHLREAANRQPSEVPAKPVQQSGSLGNTDSSVEKAADSQTSYVPATAVGSGLNIRDYFLDSDKVDITAEPDEEFSSRLASLLPLTTQNIVLEFWIEKDGRTVEVKCVDGDCNSDVLDSLPKLIELVFTPATKNSEVVANRKVIQIDRKPNSGL